MPRAEVNVDVVDFGGTFQQHSFWNACNGSGSSQAIGAPFTTRFKHYLYISPGISTRPWSHTLPYKVPTSYSVKELKGSAPLVFVSRRYDSGTSPPCVDDPNQHNFDYVEVGWVGNLVDPAFTFGVYNSDLRALVDNQMLTVIKDDGSASLGLALLERKQTEHLLTGALTKIASSIDTISRIKRQGMRKVFQAYKIRSSGKDLGRLTRRERSLARFPEWWLEVQYGWKPLMMDVHDAMKAVDYYQQNHCYRFGKVVKRSLYTSEYAKTVVADNLHFSGSYSSGKVPIRDRCLLRCDYEVDTSALPVLSSLGLVNIANLAWELQPYSFVADWFLPLGAWFNTFDATLGKTFISGSRTETRLWESTLQLDGISGSDVVGVAVSRQGSFRQFAMDRVPLFSFPSPSPPAFKNPCSPTHVANALSLLTTALTGAKRRSLRI